MSFTPPDFKAVNLWQAQHDQCPWPGCDGCQFQELPRDLFQLAEREASSRHEPIDSVLHYWALAGRAAASVTFNGPSPRPR